MNDLYYNEIIKKTSETLIKAASTCNLDKQTAYKKAMESETVPTSKWVLENLLLNAEASERMCSPICDDSGIPHIILEVGKSQSLPSGFMQAIEEGVSQGLKKLPGRPMALLGNDVERISQTAGINPDSEALVSAPIMLIPSDKDKTTLHILMQGGGPEIRAKTFRVFHKHSVTAVVDEVVNWASEVVGLLGCTPCTLAVGIGRSHYEASSLMLQAMVNGQYSIQNEIEKEITSRVNKTDVGPLGLHGNNTVLATFTKIGPQRASGVRIVCMRPCCCVEPRVASVEFEF